MDRTNDHLIRRFAETFSGEPAGIVRAPGRVNLIGDHIDYNGLPVLPMAIQREVRVAFRPRNDSVVRVIPGRQDFGQREFSIDARVRPYPQGDWGNYLKAAAQTVADRHGCTLGLDAVIDSDIPVAAGLSSSSALVVAFALAVIRANGKDVSRFELAVALARGERYVGTQGGGMDQAVSLLSEAGSASFISFEPLAVESVPVPDHWRFIVASSMVDAKKSGLAQAAYNLRTTECELAREKLAAHLGEPVASYRELLDSRSCPELLRLSSEVCGPPLLQRLRHVLCEADRVKSAADSLRSQDEVEFGRLMARSHCSLKDDYEVSCPELDRLVEIAVDSGALGARLTGAGFGGSVVALATVETAAPVLEGLQSRFFEPLDVDATSNGVLFVARPVAGASVATMASRF